MKEFLFISNVLRRLKGGWLAEVIKVYIETLFITHRSNYVGLFKWCCVVTHKLYFKGYDCQHIARIEDTLQLVTHNFLTGRLRLRVRLLNKKRTQSPAGVWSSSSISSTLFSNRYDIKTHMLKRQGLGPLPGWGIRSSPLLCESLCWKDRHTSKPSWQHANNWVLRRLKSEGLWWS